MTHSTANEPADFFHSFGVSDAALSAADKAIDAAQRIAVVGHIRPDPDAIGSVCALVHHLHSARGKQAIGLVGQNDLFSHNLFSIPGAEEIRHADHLPDDVDLVITVDCGDLGRTGLLVGDAEKMADRGKLIMIDHHSTNVGSNSINIIAKDVESTTMVLWEWFKLRGESFDEKTAHCLYAGLVTDTGCFRFGGPRMHDMAGELLGYGLNPRQIAFELIDSTSTDCLQMKGSILSHITTVDPGEGALKFCVLVASHDKITGRDMSAVESLTDYIRAVDHTDFGVLLKEYVPGTYQVSLRSHSHVISPIAQALGGGGHDYAAGATITGLSAQQAIDLIAEKARQFSHA